MSLISRYILRSAFPTFLFGATLVMSLFLLQFLINNIDKLVGKGIDTFVIIQLIATNLAWMLILAIPMGMLFSSLMTFGNLSLTFETTVIKASGGSLIKMMTPLAIAGLALSFFLLWFNDSILPDANHSAKIMLSDIQRKKPSLIIDEGVFSSQLEGYTILTRTMDTANSTMRNSTIYNNTNLRYYSVINSDSGKIKFTPDYTKLVLSLYSGEMIRAPRNNSNNTRIIKFEKALINLDASGFSFTRSNEELFSRGQREMNIADLKNIAINSDSEEKKTLDIMKQRLKKRFDDSFVYRESEGKFVDSTILNAYERIYNIASGIESQIESDIKRAEDSKMNSNEYWVEVHKKFAIPFACFLFVFVGCPLGVITKGGNFGLSAAISLGFYIFYWASLMAGEKLGDRGYLHPFIAMWLGNFIIIILGVILTLRVNNETFSLKKALKGIIRR